MENNVQKTISILPIFEVRFYRNCFLQSSKISSLYNSAPRRIFRLKALPTCHSCFKNSDLKGIRRNHSTSCPLRPPLVIPDSLGYRYGIHFLMYVRSSICGTYGWRSQQPQGSHRRERWPMRWESGLPVTSVSERLTPAVTGTGVHPHGCLCVCIRHPRSRYHVS